MKRLSLGVALLLTTMLYAEVAHTQTLATVAVVNINQVYNSFYRDSQSVRDLERLRREYQAEIDGHLRDLDGLRNRRAQAVESNNQRRADELDSQIAELQRFLEDLTRRRRHQLESRQADLVSDTFLQQLQEAIQFVAEANGYSIVIRSDTAGLQWWSSEVDVSDLVLQRLNQTVSR